MPKGVEHKHEAKDKNSLSRVESLMPKGVEHVYPNPKSSHLLSVESLMPKGVEHPLFTILKGA